MLTLFQCFLFTDISGPSLGPMQIGDTHLEQKLLVPFLRGCLRSASLVHASPVVLQKQLARERTQAICFSVMKPQEVPWLTPLAFLQMLSISSQKGCASRKAPKQMLWTGCFCFSSTSLPARVLWATHAWKGKNSPKPQQTSVNQRAADLTGKAWEITGWLRGIIELLVRI